MGVQTRLEKIGFEQRSGQSNEYSDEKDYSKMYQEILKGSELKQLATRFREDSHPQEHLELEEPYLGTGYGLAKVKKGNPEDGGHTHSIPNPNGNQNEFRAQIDTFNGGDEIDRATREKLRAINTYDANRGHSIKKGNPEDGGHTHSIPSDNYSPHRYNYQLDTFHGGDERDVAARERLLAINKYSRAREYNESSIDTTENIMDGQYFIP